MGLLSPLLGPKRTLLGHAAMSAHDAVDGARSVARRRNRSVHTSVFPLALAFLHWTTDEVGYPRNEARHLSHISRILFVELTQGLALLGTRQAHIHEDQDREHRKPA